MEKETIKTLSDVVDAVTTKETTIEFDIHPRNKLHAWLQKKGRKPLKKKYVLRPITTGNLYRISRLLLSINIGPEQIKNGFSIETFHHAVVEHVDTMIRICAIGIHNSRTEPGAELLDEIRWNLSAPEVLQVAMIILQQMNPSVFMQSIILMRGLNILQSVETKKEPNEVSQLFQGS
jgi:hypothetical protein